MAAYTLQPFIRNPNVTCLPYITPQLKHFQIDSQSSSRPFFMQSLNCNFLAVDFFFLLTLLSVISVRLSSLLFFFFFGFSLLVYFALAISSNLHLTCVSVRIRVSPRLLDAVFTHFFLSPALGNGQISSGVRSLFFGHVYLLESFAQMMHYVQL